MQGNIEEKGNFFVQLTGELAAVFYCKFAEFTL
jgi:hypothetical protein